MHRIQVLNNISQTGLSLLSDDQFIVGDTDTPDALLLRSASLHDMAFPKTLRCIGRAGAGTNNIPIDKATASGIVVMNTPGANANAVKELVLTGLLLTSRHIAAALQYTQRLEGDDATLHKQVEAGKKQFKGIELPGRTLGIIGLGHIGIKVANAAIALGMRVVGFDPAMTVENAWKLSANVEQAHSVEDLLKVSEFLTLHVPLIEQTKHLINAERLQLMPKNSVVLNFARDGIVANDALLGALNNNHIAAYATDFPSNALRTHERVVSLPHLGASTVEAEENCARMIAEQTKDFLQNGNIKFSVNFPPVHLSPNPGTHRISVVNENVPNMVAQISSTLARAKANIVDMLNKSRGAVAYNLIDIDVAPDEALCQQLQSVKGVLRVNTF